MSCAPEAPAGRAGAAPLGVQEAPLRLAAPSPPAAHSCPAVLLVSPGGAKIHHSHTKTPTLNSVTALPMLWAPPWRSLAEL